jgi:hypothetical protein
MRQERKGSRISKLTSQRLLNLYGRSIPSLLPLLSSGYATLSAPAGVSSRRATRRAKQERVHAQPSGSAHLSHPHSSVSLLHAVGLLELMRAKLEAAKSQAVIAVPDLESRRQAFNRASPEPRQRVPWPGRTAFSRVSTA